MTENNNDSMINKIVGLLAKAESTSHPEEAKAYSAKAQALMTKYQIDEARLAAAAAANGAVEQVPADERIWMPGTMYKASTMQLWYNVMVANGVEMVVTSGERYYENWKKEGYTRPYIRGTYYHLFGFPRQLETAKMLATSLMLQMENEFRSQKVQDIMGYETTTAPSKVQWKNGFIFGYAAEISRKLLAAKRSAESEPGTALVLVRRDELVKEAKSKAYPKLHKVSSSAGQGYNSGRALGREAGSRADIGQTRVSNTNRKAL